MTARLFRSPIFFVLILLGSCSAEKAPSSTISIGIAIQKNSSRGKQIKDAIKLYQENAPRPSVCFGRDIRLVVDDSALTPEEATISALNLIQKENIFLLIGPNTSDTALPVAEIAERSKTPMISLLSTYEKVSLNKNYVFQFSLSNVRQINMVSRFFKEEENYTAGAIVFNVTSLYSRNFAEQFAKNFVDSDRRLKSVSFVDINKDIEAITSTLRNQKLDFVIAPIDTEDAMVMLSGFRKNKINTKIYGTDTWELEKLKLEEDFEGTFVFDHWHQDLYERHLLNRRWLSKGFKATMSTSITVDALDLTFDYLCSHEVISAEAFIKHLNSIHQFEGLSGDIEKFENNQAIRDLYLFQFEQNQVRLLRSVKQSNAHETIQP